MENRKEKSFGRAFFDFFVLFSGISTASNLARVQGRPLWTRGIFLFRRPKKAADPDGAMQR
jgi:hypothetical protein